MRGKKSTFVVEVLVLFEGTADGENREQLVVNDYCITNGSVHQPPSFPIIESSGRGQGKLVIDEVWQVRHTLTKRGRGELWSCSFSFVQIAC